MLRQKLYHFCLHPHIIAMRTPNAFSLSLDGNGWDVTISISPSSFNDTVSPAPLAASVGPSLPTHPPPHTLQHFLRRLYGCFPSCSGASTSTTDPPMPFAAAPRRRAHSQTSSLHPSLADTRSDSFVPGFSTWAQPRMERGKWWPHAANHSIYVISTAKPTSVQSEAIPKEFPGKAVVAGGSAPVVNLIDDSDNDFVGQ